MNDPGDPLLNAWIVNWAGYALTHHPLQLFSAPVFHPASLPLAYSENLVAVALLMLPLQLAGASAITVHNVAFLLGFALSGYGAYVLARMVCRSTPAAIAGGIFYAFCSFKFDHIAHLQIVFSPWVPLALAALISFWRKPDRWRGLWIGLTWVALGLTNIYFLIFVTVAAFFTIVLLATIQPLAIRAYVRLAVSLGLAFLVLLPFLSPYRTVAKKYEMVRSAAEVRSGSATWTDWLVPTPSNRAYGRIPSKQMIHGERRLFPGFFILFLATAGWFLWRDEQSAASPPPFEARNGRAILLALDSLIVGVLLLTWAAIVSDRVDLKRFGLSVEGSAVPLMAAIGLIFTRFAIRLPNALGGVPLRVSAARWRFNPAACAAAVWIIVGVLGSLGLNAFFYTFLYRWFEPFHAMRVAARFAIVAYAGLAVWGALGAAALIRAQAGWRRTAVPLLLVILMVADVRPFIRWQEVPRETLPVYTWLARTRVGPIAELPFSGGGVDYMYMLGSTTHHVPMANGTSGFFPPSFYEVANADALDAYDELLSILERQGVRLIIVHGDLYSAARHARVADFIRRNGSTHRLAFVRRFDNQKIGDYVFAITRNLPDSHRLRAPDVPDAAGNLPDQNLARFLDGEMTHSEAIIVNMDYPQPWMIDVPSPLRISGWTISPHGIRRATAIFQEGRQRYEMQLVSRPDVCRVFHWQTPCDRQGFELLLPKRPKGIAVDTSVQVEVEDGAGRIRRGQYTLLRWMR